jgi:hypothetical protein
LTGGKQDTSGGGGIPLQNGALLFSTIEPFILNTVDVYIPEGGPQGVRFIQLWSNDSLVASKQFAVAQGLNVLHLDFNVAAGRHMLTSPQGNMFRNDDAVNFPYPIGDIGEIISSSNGDNYYYYFYNWKITLPGITCVSNRVPVNIIISSANETAEDGFTVFPNPAKESLVIISDESSFTASLVSMSGQSFSLARVIENTYRIPSVPPGFYILQLINNKGICTKRVIILE